MVRKIINNNKQNVKQSVVVKVHIGDKKRKKGGKRIPRKRSGGGGVGTAQAQAHQYTPVYIQSGNPSPPPPPQAEETSALLTIIKDYKHKEELQNALHKQVGAVKIKAEIPAQAPQTPIKVEAPQTPKTPKLENTYSNKTTPIVDGKNPSLLDTVKGITPSREFIGKGITNYTSQEELKPILHYNKGNIIKSTGEFNPDYEEEEEKNTRTRKTGIPKFKKNGEPRKERKDKGMRRGTHTAGFKNGMDTNDD